MDYKLLGKARVLKRRREGYIAEVSAKFNNIYDYSITEYTKLTLDINFICPSCGVVTMNAGKHAKHPTGCYKCAEPRVKRLSAQELLQKCFEVHDGRYSYENSDFKRTKDSISVTCPVHGSFEIRTDEHSKGKGCKKCAHDRMRDSEEEFKSKIIKRFGDFYIFDKLKYTRQEDDVTLICPVHGEFTMKAYKLLHGIGCEKCKHSYKHKQTYLYVVTYSDWLKVGISTEPKARLTKINKASGKDFTSLKTYVYDNFFIASDAEKMTLTYLRNRYKNVPVKFVGSTETFENVIVPDLLNHIEDGVNVYF